MNILLQYWAAPAGAKCACRKLLISGGALNMKILVLFFALFLPSKATEPWIELAGVKDASVRFAADNRDRFFDLNGHADGKVPPEAVGVRVHGLHVKEWAGICRSLRDLKSLSIESTEALIWKELLQEICQIKGFR
jgi:hypothetical protein